MGKLCENTGLSQGLAWGQRFSQEQTKAPATVYRVCILRTLLYIMKTSVQEVSLALTNALYSVLGLASECT